MRYAILADIHGNSHAMMAVMKDIGKQYVDGYFCVGDYFGDFPYPNEVTDTIKSLKESHIIKGNKEEYLIDLHASDKKAAWYLQEESSQPSKRKNGFLQIEKPLDVANIIIFEKCERSSVL